MLDDVKTLIGLSAEDDSQDEKLKLVIELASARLAAHQDENRLSQVR